MNPLSEARAAVAAVAASTGLAVHATPPEVVSPPCAWITPDAQWLAPHTLAGVKVQLNLTAVVGLTGSNDAAATALEDQLWDLWTALQAANVQVLELDAVTLDPSQNLATASLRVAVYVTQEG